ncbi:hypothetical protein LX36DRAFT_64056 [Colletotrichum falcatum]|nr:hypothetical protein LX36DRAFT_64056 [Colletotrichum falcatum]
MKWELRSGWHSSRAMVVCVGCTSFCKLRSGVAPFVGCLSFMSGMMPNLTNKTPLQSLSMVTLHRPGRHVCREVQKDSVL